MNSRYPWMLTALLAVAAIVPPLLSAPQEEDSEEPERATRVPVDGIFPTEVMIENIINRLTSEMAERYEMDYDQLDSTRALIKERIPVWLQRNKAEIKTLTNYWFENIFGEEPPTPEDVAKWSKRVLPLVNEFTGLIQETTTEMKDFLTEDQQVKLDGEMAAFNVGVGFMNTTLGRFVEGGFNPDTDWPGSSEGRRRQREREREMQVEMERQKAEAMAQASGGVAPEHADDAGGETAGAPKPTPPAGKTAAKAKDEWEVYVENFIKRYQLDDATQNKAREFLRAAIEQRDKHLLRKKEEIDKVFARLNAAKTEEEKKELAAAYEELNRPIERTYANLKDKLEKLPTRAQRAAAGKAAADKPAKPGESKRGAAAPASNESPDTAARPADKQGNP